MRTAMKYLECEARGMTRKAIAAKFGVTPSAVSHAIRRMLGEEPGGGGRCCVDPDVLDRLDPKRIVAQA